MANHPHRGWRKTAQQAADQWLESDEARELAVAQEARRESVRDLLRLAYLAGYRDRHLRPRDP